MGGAGGLRFEVGLQLEEGDQVPSFQPTGLTNTCNTCIGLRGDWLPLLSVKKA